MKTADDNFVPPPHFSPEQRLAYFLAVSEVLMWVIKREKQERERISDSDPLPFPLQRQAV